MRRFERNEKNEIVCDDNPGVWLTNTMKRPDSFAYFGGDDRMFVTWALGPVIEHRDSGALDRSNAKALRRFLSSDPSLADEYTIERASHWAVGWVEHLSFRAYDSDDDKTKRPARIARVLAAWFTYLEEQYPVADEDLMSEMEHEEADRVWRSCYDEAERIEYIRRHRSQFEFHGFADLMGCVRGKYFAGYANELLG